jgi:hypothetical protein
MNFFAKFSLILFERGFAGFPLTVESVGCKKNSDPSKQMVQTPRKTRHLLAGKCDFKSSVWRQIIACNYTFVTPT